MSAVVTRFAPSPTGYLHIGGARTALFNLLYARHTGGKFLVRVEDTDRERSTDAAVKAIFDGLDWLGLQADEPPVFQFSRAERHRQVVDELLAEGGAYRCWMTPEETQAARDEARAAGRALQSPWRDRTPERAQLAHPHVIRFRGPGEGTVTVQDLVQGEVSWPARDLDDLVLLRSDGAPTYNLAVVVDDHDMGVTHVIRGDDHLNNAARQALIYDALGWGRPAFAHIPLIHGPDGAKLSKRHGAQAVGDYAALGYLPEAMRNYLARLGWSHGDDEIFSDEQAVEWFDIRDANRAPARLDFDKLAHVNAWWMRQADPVRLAGLVVAARQAMEVAPTPDDMPVLMRAIPQVVERASTIPQLVEQTAFALQPRPIQLNDKTRALLTEETSERFRRLHAALSAAEPWAVEMLEPLLKGFAEAEGVGMGKIGPALRGCLAGSNIAPDLARTLAALGREESLARLNDALIS
ncbi:MAG TPA: glutamate--tRNA ligase [Caulobacteraceae bacterium]